ncbi:protein FAM227A-like isoform X2 [Hydractinia symbiolongicarpus]|uniref:protein FAM227A-like isoform X2 n=1 Tax=Hydractinia symbiolongicarpus TaxID=13093 RepID=UPI00255010C5|nr:protein FAM227A-like isoform X2 [Hydractinia symbiolongicarpus]
MDSEEQTHEEKSEPTTHLGNSDSEFKLVKSAANSSSAIGSHAIYTIDELNERISNLHSSMSDFYNKGQSLAIDEDDEDSQNELNELRKKHQDSESDRKAVQKFSGVYSTHKILGSSSSTVNQRGNFHTKKKLRFSSDEADRSVGKRPVLVELYSFPGYDEVTCTPLPYPLKARSILNILLDAQRVLKKKPALKNAFKDFVQSNSSQAILQDSFWWYFCHKYQPTMTSQSDLFARIARNYTNLLVTWTGRKYQEMLFKDYANLMSQAIYSTFCYAFPASYRQFNGCFRDDLLGVITMWMMGTKPALRSWKNWNFTDLEPAGLRKGEKIKDDAGKDFEFKQTEEKRKNERHSARKLSSLEPFSKNNFDPFSNQSKTSEVKQDESMEQMLKQISSVLGIVEAKKKKQSCAAEESPTFAKVAFDLHGRSPLVAHFLESHNLLPDAGTSVLVQRTEISSLPSLSAKTYDEVIQCTKDSLNDSQTKYENASQAHANERLKCIQKQKMKNLQFTRCSGKLLSNPQEVKKISDLLRLPGKEEPEDADIRCAKLRSLVGRALEEEDHK